DGPVHRDCSCDVCSRVRTGAGPSPVAEAVTDLSVGGWRSGDRNSCSAVFPPASGTYLAATSSVHRQVALRGKVRGVSRVLSWSDAMRDSSAITPLTPRVANACVTALGEACGDRVARTGRPGKCLRRAVGSAVNRECKICQICLDRCLNSWSSDRGGFCG